MKVAIMQPYFFPYIGYFQTIHAVDKFILYDKVNFIKKAWMNRNRFLIVNGEPTFFYAELKEKSSYKKINEIELVNNSSWRTKILNNLFYNYKKADYFEEIFPLIEIIVNFPTSKLSELNYQSITQVCNYLQLSTSIEKCSDKYIQLENNLLKEIINENDFLNINTTNLQRKTIRILSICKQEKANIYINSIGGKNLYNKEEFNSNGIILYFVNTLDFNYRQKSLNYYANLSIVDVLMNCGKKGTINLIKKYELI